MRKLKFSYQHQNMSMSQGYSNEYIKEPSFSSNKDEKMKDYHENYKCKEKDLESQEIICRKKNGSIFCNACKMGIKGIMNKDSGIIDVSTSSLNRHLTGVVHTFSLQIYKNTSKAAMLITEALDQDIIRKYSYRFYCRSCHLILEYDSIALLAGHLLNVEHLECLKNASAHLDPKISLKSATSLKNTTILYPNPLRLSSSTIKETKMETENGSFDQLTVMACRLCNAEMCALNIDTHIASARHLTKVGNLKGNNTNQAFPRSKDMEPDEAIKCGILKVKDVMTYFCNACNKQVPYDGTLSPLKNHLKSTNHKLRTVFSEDKVKKAVEEEIMTGILTFKFKANEVKPEYSEKYVDPNNTNQYPASFQDTVSQQHNEFQGDESIHIIKEKQMESHPSGPNTVKDRWMQPSRVIHVFIKNRAYKEPFKNERLLIEMASPYGEVVCVKIMGRKKNDNRMALLEMVDLVAAKNLMNNFDQDKKHFQNFILKYSEHKFINNGHRLVSQKMFTETNTKTLGREIHCPVSQKSFFVANNEPLGHEIHRPVLQKYFSGAINEQLGHTIQRDHQHISQKKLPPKKISDRKLLQPDHFNVDKEHTVSYDKTEHIPAYQPWKNVHKEASKTIIDYGHKEASTNVIDYGHKSKTTYPSIVNNLTVAYPSNVPFSDNHKSAPMMLRKSYNFGAQNILPSTSMQRPIQTENIRKMISSDITQSLDLRSGKAAELNIKLKSMSAEQRKMWEQRLVEMKQEIEEDGDLSNPSVVTTNSEWGESRKRQHHNARQERTNLLDFASEKTSGYSENRYDCNSKDVETSYWSKRRKF